MILKLLNEFLAFNSVLSPEEHKTDKPKDYIILKADKKNYKIKFSDIVFVESLDYYIKVHTPEFFIVCFESLLTMEEQLPASKFIRIHRSYIINFHKVDIFTSSYVEINNRIFIIGRNYKKKVAKRLSRF